MKKTSQDSTLDFFWLLSKNFFSKIWAAKLRVRLICRCGLSAGFYGNRKDKCHQWWWLHGPLGLSTDISFDLFMSLSVIICFICLNYSGLSIQNGTSDERFVFNIESFIRAIRWFFFFFITLEIFASLLVHTDLPYEHHGLIMVIELSRVHCGLKSYIQVISKLNKHAARVWFEITSMISDQNCLT